MTVHKAFAASLAFLAVILASACSSEDAPEPTPTPDPLPFTVTAVGDSVMLAAIDALKEAGIHVDAVVGRQTAEAVDVLRGMATSGELGEVVVVHIGHNGAFTDDDLATIAAITGPGRRLVLLDVRVPRDWEATNNEVIQGAIATYPNVTVFRWRDATEGRPDLFWEDGIHLNPAGAAFYAEFLIAALQSLPE